MTSKIAIFTRLALPISHSGPVPPIGGTGRSVFSLLHFLLTRGYVAISLLQSFPRRRESSEIKTKGISHPGFRLKAGMTASSNYDIASRQKKVEAIVAY